MNGETGLASEFIKIHPTDAAQILERFQIEEIVAFLQELAPPLAAQVVQSMDGLTAAQSLQRMSTLPSSAIVAELSIEITPVLLRRIDPSKREPILGALPDKVSESLRLMLRYPEDSAGVLMNPQAFTLPDDITVGEALKRIQKSEALRNAGVNQTQQISEIYVVNRESVLVGAIVIHQLMVAEAANRIVSIMRRNIGKLSPNMTHQAIMAHPGWHECHTLPVVNERGIFLGAIEYQTLRRLLSDATARQLSERRNDAGAALGELYGIGLSAIVRGAASIMFGGKEE